MSSKSKVFYAPQELLPFVVEALNLQLGQDYKVKVENHTGAGTELIVTKNEFLSWAGAKIQKTISLTPASNGQIMCQITGLGWGGILVPIIAALVLDTLGFAFPLFWVVSLFIECSIGYGLFCKYKLNKEIFEIIKESIEANKNMVISQNTEKKCPNCGFVSKGSGFCPECGTKIN